MEIWWLTVSKSKIGSWLGVNQRACWTAVVKMIFCYNHWFSLRPAPLGLVLTALLRKVSTCTLPQLCSKGGKCYPSNQREWILKYLSSRYWIQRLSNQALIESQRRELKNDRNKLFWPSLGVRFRRFSLQQRCSVLKQSSLVNSHQEMQCLETTWSLNTWSPQKLNVAISARERPSAFHLIIRTTLLRIRCSTNARLTTINSKMMLQVSWVWMDSVTMNVRYMMNTS